MSTILKALRRLEEDDARKARENAGEERPEAEGSESNPTIPASAYAAADELAKAASPPIESPSANAAAEATAASGASPNVASPTASGEDGFSLDRALVHQRSRAILAVATAVGLVALTFGAMSLRESGGGLLLDEATPSPASSPSLAQRPLAPTRSTVPNAPIAQGAAANRDSTPAETLSASPSQTAQPVVPAIPAVPFASTPSPAPRALESLAVASSSSAAPIAQSSQRVSAVDPTPPPSKPIRSRPPAATLTPPTAPKAAKSSRTTSSPSRGEELANAAVTPTRAAEAGAAAAAGEEIAKATESLAARSRPRAERVPTPAPVSSPERSSARSVESLPLAETWPVKAPPETVAAPAPTNPTRATMSASRAQDSSRLTPLEQARAMESSSAFGISGSAASVASPPSSPDSLELRQQAPFEDRSVSQPAPVRAARDAGSAERLGEVERIDRRGLPDVRVLRTAWHPQPARRTASVRVDASSDILTLREGDAVGGLVVQAITPSSVLFESGGIEIRRRVGADR